MGVGAKKGAWWVLGVGCEWEWVRLGIGMVGRYSDGLGRMRWVRWIAWVRGQRGMDAMPILVQ